MNSDIVVTECFLHLVNFIFSGYALCYSSWKARDRLMFCASLLYI